MLFTRCADGASSTWTIRTQQKIMQMPPASLLTDVRAGDRACDAGRQRTIRPARRPRGSLTPSMTAARLPGDAAASPASSASTTPSASWARSLALGVPLDKIAGAPWPRPRASRAGWRWCPTPGKDYTVLIDYAHTPDSLGECPPAPCGVSAGGGSLPCSAAAATGTRSSGPSWARSHRSWPTSAVVTSDNPRTEDPDSHHPADPRRHARSTEKPYEVIEDRGAAIGWAMDHGAEGRRHRPVRQGPRDLSGDRTREAPSGRARGRRVVFERSRKMKELTLQAGRRVLLRKAGTGFGGYYHHRRAAGFPAWSSRAICSSRSRANRPTAMTSFPWRRRTAQRAALVSRPVEAEIPTILVCRYYPRLRRSGRGLPRARRRSRSSASPAASARRRQRR